MPSVLVDSDLKQHQQTLLVLNHCLINFFLVATEQSILESFFLCFLGNTFSSKTKENVMHGIKLCLDVIYL